MHLVLLGCPALDEAAAGQSYLQLLYPWMFSPEGSTPPDICFPKGWLVEACSPWVEVHQRLSHTEKWELEELRYHWICTYLKAVL